MNAIKTFSVIGAVIVGAMGARAFAEEGLLQYDRTATVQVADLDMTRERDVRVLYERIRYAAHSLCMHEESSFDAERASRRRRCEQTAIDRAIERIDIPLLMAVHLQQSERVTRL